MSTATLTRPERLIGATQKSDESRFFPTTKAPAPTRRHLDLWKVGGIAFIFFAGLMLCSFNLSGIVHEGEWIFFFCLLPQTIALGAIFASWFSALFFAET